MNPTIITEEVINQLLPKIDIQSALRDMFVELANQRAVQPAQSVTLFPNGQGDTITYQGVMAKQGVFGAKMSPYIIADNTTTVTAWTCLMSMKTGQPLLLCDAAKLTTERTAATTALAVDQLSKHDSKVLAIIGSGAVAAAHWRHVAELRSWSDIRLWSPNLSTNASRREEWSTTRAPIAMSASAEEACHNADVILLCTSSGVPVVDATFLQAGALVTSISTNVPGAHEVPPELLNKAQVYCDYRQTTPSSAGEMILAQRDHGWSANNIVGDLPELMIGQCQKPDDESIVFFRSLGLGLEDIAIANEVYKANLSIEESS